MIAYQSRGCVAPVTVYICDILFIYYKYFIWDNSPFKLPTTSLLKDDNLTVRNIINTLTTLFTVGTLALNKL